MLMNLRPYQQVAHDKTAEWIRRCVSPCLIEAPTGAGKSWIIAAIAKTVREMSGKRVLCLAPSAELVHQDREKYLTTGQPASLYSASTGKKCLKHPVIFATPLTAKRGMENIAPEIGCIIIDEAHGITPTVKAIIHMVRQWSPRVRVVGLTATPYRTGDGYIYAHDEDGTAVPEDEAKDPYFARLVYKISARELIQLGYLTPPNIGVVGDHYETSHMQVNSRGQFDAREVERAFEGRGRKTSAIISEVVSKSRGRNGVMIFAATIQHAEECMESLPPGYAALVTGGTPAAERKMILEQFKARQIKYLVNVSVLTTGFDAEHVDVIAILRATESPGLLLQIIGRGLRVMEGKEDCVILDYAENIKRHAPDGDIFNPDIKAVGHGSTGDPISAVCELCGAENQFPARPNDDGYGIDENGYFIDLDGQRIETDYGHLPAHHGRRCTGQVIAAGEAARCAYRWTYKKCHECGHPNDIAARYCEECKAEIVDPNEKLRLEFHRAKHDPYVPSTDEVRDWMVQPSISRAGNPTTRVTFITDFQEVTIWLSPESEAHRARHQVKAYNEATQNGTVMPSTITYCKDASNSKFWRLIAYNRPADEVPE